MKGHEAVNLPCAGITLIRFYGYHLSLYSALAEDQHPGELENQIRKIPNPAQR